MSKIFWGLLLLLLLNSCKTTKRNSVIPYSKMNKASILKIPFEFKNEELISLIDSLLPDTLLEKEKDLPYNLKVLKGKVSKISLQGKTIDIVLSLFIELDKKIGSYSIASGYGEIELDLYSEIDIDENWNLKTKTSLVEYHWIKKPSIKLIGLKLSAPDLVEQYIDYKQLEWMNQIDSAIEKTNLLTKPIALIDKYFSSPIIIDSTGVIGLKITPKVISLIPFKSSSTTTQGQFEISFLSELVPMNKYKNTDTTYTRFGWVYNKGFTQKAVFILSLNQKLTQDLVSKFLAAQDSTIKTFDIKGNKITIDTVNVVFSDDVIGTNINFSGNKIGRIKVTTRPSWNKEIKYLSLHQRHVDIKMNDIGSQVFLSLFGKTIKKKIMNGLEEKLNLKIKDLVNESNNALKNIKYNNTLKITNYDLPMQLEGGYFMIDIGFSISGNINWNKLNIVLKD